MTTSNSDDEKSTRKEDVNIPKHFCCPLTLEVMVEPVLDREGNTFEKNALIESLNKKRQSPISLQPLNEDTIVPNIALREAIHEFMGSEWSAKHNANRNKGGCSSSERGVVHDGKYRQRVNGWLMDISRAVGKNLELNEDGICAFTYDDFTLVIEVPKSVGSFFIYQQEIYPSLSSAQKDKILELNYLFQETRGGCLAVKRTDLGSDEVTYSYVDRIFEIDAKVFCNVLENFIDTCISLRKIVRNPKTDTEVTDEKTPVADNSNSNK